MMSHSVPSCRIFTACEMRHTRTRARAHTSARTRALAHNTTGAGCETRAEAVHWEWTWEKARMNVQMHTTAKRGRTARARMYAVPHTCTCNATNNALAMNENEGTHAQAGQTRTHTTTHNCTAHCMATQYSNIACRTTAQRGLTQRTATAEKRQRVYPHTHTLHTHHRTNEVPQHTRDHWCAQFNCPCTFTNHHRRATMPKPHRTVNTSRFYVTEPRTVTRR